MIQILRNHPSIVAWSTGNEDFFVPSDRLPKVRDFLKRLAAAMRAADPTRPTAMGGVQRGDLDKLDGSIAGYNGDGARLFLNPGVPNLVSEYGSTIANRPGNYAPGYGDLLQGPGDRSVPYYWRYPWRSGEVIWCGFDHGSIASIPFGSMGLIDYFRLPKRQYYWYRNELLQTPPPAWPQAGTPAKLRLESDHTTISGTDATDDVHLVCTVLDVNSVPISNSPPVTLTVVSGPGEFPTGQSITFTLDSDIAIRDGQCAIAMRSYYAGPSVIQAASPGLEPASITINTTGTQLFVPGVTPPPEPHPYTRYVAPPGAADATVFCVSSERPTEASSEAPGHPAKFANDADPTTWWQPAAGDAHPWWGVDLENTYRIQRVSITFPTAGNYRYVVQVSPDKTTWTTVDDESASNLTDQTRTDSGNFGSGMRFLRIQVTGVPAGAPAGIAEVAVFGGN